MTTFSLYLQRDIRALFDTGVLRYRWSARTISTLFIVMGLIWSIYGVGYKGPAPSWKVLDVVQGEPAQSRVAKADSLPLPDKIADPVELRDGSKELLKEFPATGKDPVIGDLAAIDPELEASINQQVDPWKLLITTNRFTGETQATVAEALGPNGQKLFEDPSEYVVVQSFFTGGKQGRTDNSIVGRVAYKAKSAVSFFNPPFLVAVQLQEVIPQDTRVGQAPPLPVRNREAPVITVVKNTEPIAMKAPASTASRNICNSGRLPFATPAFSALTAI